MASREGTVNTKLPVPNSGDVIVLLDPEDRPTGIESWHPFPNIMRITPAGELAWQCALLPEETAWKCYLSVQWVGEILIAEAPSYRVTLDPASGVILDSEFTK